LIGEDEADRVIEESKKMEKSLQKNQKKQKSLLDFR
jgi:hypothetical protein